MIRFKVFAYDFQDSPAVPLTRKCNVEVSHLQLKQTRQQLGVIDIRTVRRIEVAAGTGMNPDAASFLRCEPLQREVVQVNEAVEKMPGRIDFYGQPSFREVDLNLIRAFLQAAPDFGFVLVQQVVDKLLSRVVFDFLWRIHQTQSRR